MKKPMFLTFRVKSELNKIAQFSCTFNEWKQATRLKNDKVYLHFLTWPWSHRIHNNGKKSVYDSRYVLQPMQNPLNMAGAPFERCRAGSSVMITLEIGVLPFILAHMVKLYNFVTSVAV